MLLVTVTLTDVIKSTVSYLHALYLCLPHDPQGKSDSATQPLTVNVTFSSETSAVTHPTAQRHFIKTGAFKEQNEYLPAGANRLVFVMEMRSVYCEVGRDVLMLFG